MSGIYIHIPFCKQACHYCDFHFSTSMKKKDDMVLALAKEIGMRKNELLDSARSDNEIVETIYFGGGTPSVLSNDEINFLISEVYKNYKVVENPEITLEANPDDLSVERILELSKSPINRLSIGIQSFYEEDLKMMNRAHNSAEAKKCLEEATKYFDNISLDLIYGIPGMSDEMWKQNIQTALDFGIPHISSYALTVEPKTALSKLIQTGKIAEPQDEATSNHFTILVEMLQKNGFVHYELSNFGKEDYFSKNNSAYWLGKKYIGIGPSAHSYDGEKRGWNIANNSLYLKAIQNDELPIETETLTISDRYNEYIMTGLRTIWGVSLNRIEQEFGSEYLNYLLEQSQKFLNDDLLSIENNILKPTLKGKFLTDGIASDLFYLEPEI
ncbi:radical SAM family heme chaperone HemW [Flavobacterium johnsoniae]|uniref:Heme chaperone HemW n=1 Tax=Flavobacterium johnsoniae (strain ATCC 17061 / DSM 2064 / JCM 8514 / BCRC 14874 / CCUG 350202 / NBRC 14942 / NCIMB 11054 / UW101) TaxID=376686 RepID=A5FK61_FLAJ1|nr:radical SAM family heme chaperone HemW [Flavobacterium johnsoniae]ABQ04408.1 putative oxygen-independent coproporphyrinogen III oxidase [Flavobacterium johnsoniae UW101]OXE97733.1 coproporphyrinogen III oxidase [Flavobacterium johnsoniae UW101]WQG83798.1 radical SAM family heme chaperone HemW [Flavobacterium johnsoniae UW101]SHK21672.1 oxygen-independent coproporphyrinogen-3 oxidase [Flavobacterium johnsoniae]